jgi:predicted RNA-binding Zn ribbon-like protein
MPITRPRQDLCLDFVNTRYWRGSEKPTEQLNDFTDLLSWISRAALAANEKLSAPAPAERGAELLVEAIDLRETICRIFSALAKGDEMAEQDFMALERALAEAPPRDALARADGRYGWKITEPTVTTPQLLAPVLWSAGDLLVEAPRHRIRCCANPKCRWLFLDGSKSGTRRWCQMSACGNREKARRHYSKVRKS